MVAVEDIGAPKLYLDEQKRPCEHGVIVKVIASCICGSDLHMCVFVFGLHGLFVCMSFVISSRHRRRSRAVKGIVLARL